jgi:hypothetical protein
MFFHEWLRGEYMFRVFSSAILLFFLIVINSWSADFSLLLDYQSVQAVVSQTIDNNGLGETLLNGRLLYGDDKDTLLGSAAVGVRGEPDYIDGLKLGAEIIGNWGRSNKQDILNVGLGASANYQPLQFHGLGVYGRIHYSPELLSFLDSEWMLETALGVFYTFTPLASFVVEYQNIEVDFDKKGSRRIDDSVRFGLQFYF